MRLRNLFVVLVVALGLCMVGCKGKEEDKKEEAKKETPKADEAKAKEQAAKEQAAKEPKAEEPATKEPVAKEAKTEEPKAIEAVANEAKTEEPKAIEAVADKAKTEEPKAEEPKAVAPTPENLDAKGTVEFVFKAVQSQQFAPVAGLFPAKYLTDVDGLVQAFAKTMDAELWTKTVSLLDRIFKVAVAQKGDLAKMVAGVFMPSKSDDVEKAIVVLAETWGMLKEMGLTDLNKLKTFSTSEFAAAGLPKVIEKLWAFADETQKAQMQAGMAVLATAQVKVLATTQDEKWGEVVELEINVAGQGEKGKMIQVDGKWVPLEMAEDWDNSIKEAMAGIADLATELPKVKPDMMTVLAEVESTLDEVEKSGNLSALQKQLGGMMGMPGPAADTKVIEAPATGTAPAVEEAPAAKEAPAVEEAPAAKDAPAVEEAPAAKEAPKAE
jgi:hypothetical protein